MDLYAGLKAALDKGRDREISNLIAGNEWANPETARRILRLAANPES